MHRGNQCSQLKTGRNSFSRYENFTTSIPLLSKFLIFGANKLIYHIETPTSINVSGVYYKCTGLALTLVIGRLGDDRSFKMHQRNNCQ